MAISLVLWGGGGGGLAMSPEGPSSLGPSLPLSSVVCPLPPLQFFGGRKKVKAKVAEPPPQDPELEYKIAELEQLSETQVNDRLQAMLVSPGGEEAGEGRGGGGGRKDRGVS